MSANERIKPISKILVSSKVGGDSKIEQLNADAVWKLHQTFKDISNSNGEIDFSLTDLEEKIVKKSDAFVFLPIPKAIKHLKTTHAHELFREMFKAASLFVGAQTKDPNLRLNSEDPRSPLKPIVLVNHDGCWDPFKELMEHMHQLGTVTQPPDQVIHMVDSVEGAIQLIKETHKKQAPLSLHVKNHHPVSKLLAMPPDSKSGREQQPDFNVCVFCSASTKNKELIESARQLGRSIASENWGLVSGMGSTGMMGSVVEGATEVVQKEGKGWIGGSNLPRIIHMEGVPDYYDKLWLRDDIYKRMEVMIGNSQAFVVMPGGMGTVQELMALLLLKYHAEKDKPYLMRDKDFGNKPIVLVNHELPFEGTGGRKTKFWQPLVDMAEKFGFKNDIIVVDTVEEAANVLKSHHTSHQLKHSAPAQEIGASPS